jgi:hypothetical protein
MLKVLVRRIDLLPRSLRLFPGARFESLCLIRALTKLTPNIITMDRLPSPNLSISFLLLLAYHLLATL